MTETGGSPQPVGASVLGGVAHKPWRSAEAEARSWVDLRQRKVSGKPPTRRRRGVGHRMALEEATEVDHRYRRIMNPYLQHYHVPVNTDVLEIETLFVEEDDKTLNPRGVKSMGELGMVGIPAAIANAVFHATGRRIKELPITPDKLL